MGLQNKLWRLFCVPGNHDRWGGSDVPFGGPSPSFNYYFLPTGAFVDHHVKGHLFRFLRIDGEADVGPWSLERGLALGDFRSELDALDAQLQECAENETRIMLLHHSAVHRGMSLQIVPQCRARLDSFLLKHKVKIVLTGHVHEDSLTLRAVGNPWSVLEARCGSTAQLDAISATAYAISPAPTQLNSLIVHQIYRDVDAKLFWHAGVHVRTSTGFPAQPERSMTFPL